MIIKKNKEKTKEQFIKGKLTEIEIITPNVADRVLVSADKNLGLEEIMEEALECKTHESKLISIQFVIS